MRVYTKRPVADRFWSHVDKSGECWIWTGSIGTKGYGRLKVDGRAVDAHRISMLLLSGEMPSQFVLHRCDNRACVRPSHLFLGTQADNMRDMAAKGRWGRGRVILSEDMAAEIRARRQQGEKQATLARDFGVSQSQISLITNGKSWPRARN